MVSKDHLIINCWFFFFPDALPDDWKKEFWKLLYSSLCCFYLPNSAAAETDISALTWPVLTLERYVCHLRYVQHILQWSSKE